MGRIALTVMLAGVLALTGGEVATASTPGTGNGQFPQVISLPNGFQPEGISAGRGTSFYVGSLVDGAIYRGDVRTGAGSVLIPGQPGRVAAGTKVDKRNRLFVAGASSGAGHVYQDGFNANGIEASPDGRTLLVIQSNTGKLFAVSAKTGVTNEVDLHGATLTNGDGLLRRGNTLYVVRNQNNEIAVVRLDRSYRSGTLTRTITNANFDVPTTVAGFGPFLYAVNARFNTPPTPDTTYTVVRVSAR